MVRIDVVTRADEDLLLELLNTTPVVNGRRIDKLAEVVKAGEWIRARGGTGAPGEIAALVTVRDALAAVVRGEAEPASLAPRLEQIALHPVLTAGGVDWHVSAPDGSTIGARALLGWAAILQRDPARLRPCANPECRRFLLDRSNANTARWCSMALCGNRAKARRHHRRHRVDASG